MKKILILILAIIGVGLPSGASASAETISLLSYHNHAPFVTGPGRGLTFDLARMLNRQAAGRYLFQVKIIPRSRLNDSLKDWIAGTCPGKGCSQDWIVPWVNPKWGFIKGDHDNYHWKALFEDSNSIVSLSGDSFTYTAPDSLTGKVFAGMRGHHYVGIDELVTSGHITRIDGNRERDNLLKILHHRVTATLMPTSTLEYLLQQDSVLEEQADRFHVSVTKHQIYTRYLMLPETRLDLFEFVNALPVHELKSVTPQQKSL
jgi:polar amino acid transport system substrate-binding protein